MQFSRKDATNSKQLLIKLALIAFVGFGLFIAGAIVALAPQFVARLLPIPLLLIMVFMAFLSKSDRPLNENFLKVWLAVIPVSYTHLDVYKRQLLALSLAISILFVVFLYALLKHKINTGFNFWMIGLVGIVTLTSITLFI